MRCTKKDNELDAARRAGDQYASTQIDSDYFKDWVREQLIEASRMDPADVYPLETKSDAKRIARNMLQQLTWDTKRDLDNVTIAQLSGSSALDGREAFFEGFDDRLRQATVIAWLAEELLQMQSEITQRVAEPRVREAPSDEAIESFASKVYARSRDRRTTIEDAFDQMPKPEWLRNYAGDRIDLENRIISKAKSIGRRDKTRR